VVNQLHLIRPMSIDISDYERAIEPRRSSFATDSALAKVLHPAQDARVLELFLVHFSAYGVGMTEPVDGWIRRAGERCTALGLAELGRALVKHAHHEAGHHLMMVEDTKKLVERWNTRYKPTLSVDALLAPQTTPGVKRYRDLHEEVINGASPYGQLAIEYEIERLSVAHGPELVKQCVARLGPEVMSGLSFLEEHIAVDAGHTKFNAAEMNRLLQKHPEFLSGLVNAGSAALSAYDKFLGDCLSAAEEIMRRPPTS
jgi:hypothetical protein